MPEWAHRWGRVLPNPLPTAPISAFRDVTSPRKNPHFRGFLSKPGVGLEPTTPSLPWRIAWGTARHAATRSVTFPLLAGSRQCARVPRNRRRAPVGGSLSRALPRSSIRRQGASHRRRPGRISLDASRHPPPPACAFDRHRHQSLRGRTDRRGLGRERHDGARASTRRLALVVIACASPPAITRPVPCCCSWQVSRRIMGLQPPEYSRTGRGRREPTAQRRTASSEMLVTPYFSVALSACSDTNR